MSVENKSIDYRKKYELYYGIKLTTDCVIHHIDFDRTNNEIENLLLLPRKLHAKYHFILNVIGATQGFADLSLRNFNTSDYNLLIFKELPEIIFECKKWLRFKEHGYSQAAFDFIFKECNNG